MEHITLTPEAFELGALTFQVSTYRKDFSRWLLQRERRKGNLSDQDHPRRPRGSQSGRGKGRDESFQVLAKEPRGTDSHRTISKNSSGCWLLIGHKKCFVLLCPIGEQFLLSSFHEFVHDGYCPATLARFVHHASLCVQGKLLFSTFLTRTKELPMSRKNVWYAISRSNWICPANFLFLTHHNVL